MTSAHDGATTPGHPGGSTAAGATPREDAGSTSTAGPAHPVGPHASTLHDVEEDAHQVEVEAEHRPPPAGTTTNVVVAVLVVALGVAAVVGSLSLGAGSAGNPGSGTWPMVLGVVIVVLGLALALDARTTSPDAGAPDTSTSDAERFSRSSWLVVAGLATMVVFVAVIEVIGFEIPAALLAFVWLRFLGGETWRSSVLVSLGVVVAFYLVFVAALSVPIPHLF
ncbi:hypothetical protein GCM10023328_15490 [Modestobacter marinus]|uniref:DUF1468 domain-containing protein n=1 Tax=Modestobacter marinus TaxID=477641 RepID=A0A846LMY9_9ACTN|nr:tripartite tricarboxylate transporter TctB family protein [Modestobacter marinus]NIH68817.1 hypothetical protein [Modestobacter marinus]GGL60260.1 hypothetical protein GCM10011589_15380 [Modestobacter marinus]